MAAGKRKIAYEALQEKLENAIRSRIPKGKVGIAFSAGLDSGVLAFLLKKYTKKMSLLTVGVKGSADFARAEKMAKKWKMKLVKKTLSEKEINQKYALARNVLKTRDQLQCTIGVVNLSIAELAKENGIKTLFVGSGADELFCGYAVFDAHRENARECEKLRQEKVANVDAHDVQRESACGKHFGVGVAAPYLDDAFAKEAMRIPAIENLHGKYGKIRKNALRMLAEKMKVPAEIVEAPKKAMQYGSGVAKVVKKITDTSS